MPKAAYSEEERRQIRDDLIRASLELMAEPAHFFILSFLLKKIWLLKHFIISSQRSLLM